VSLKLKPWGLSLA
jgi:flagellar biosynthesis protein FlhA